MQYKNDLILQVASGAQTERPPVWLMRQAGRILPQYRKIRAKYDNFVSLIKHPELVAEITVQPVDELGVDAAIIFSDILVIPESMGRPYDLVEKTGPIFHSPLRVDDIIKLRSGVDCLPQLDYVFQGVSQTIKALDQSVPLIGFAGAPWTLMAYMVEGRGSKTFSKAKAFLYKHPRESHKLLEKITQTIIAYLKEKKNRGAVILQLFDSWAGMLNADLFDTFCLPYYKALAQEFSDTPLIFFAKGAHFALRQLKGLSGIIGLDWTINPSQAREILGAKRVVQGNLDPCCLYGSQQTIAKHVNHMIGQFGRHLIVNLGHGVYPDTPLDHVRHFIEVVKNHHYSKSEYHPNG